jgi:hypothetical protein
MMMLMMLMLMLMLMPMMMMMMMGGSFEIVRAYARLISRFVKPSMVLVVVARAAAHAADARPPICGHGLLCRFVAPPAVAVAAAMDPQARQHR